MTKKVFISYSWDNESHQNWVVELANSLRESGIDANVDVFYVHGETTNLNKMMVKEISTSGHVIVVLTEEYKNKVVNWNGGVGFESELLLPAISGQVDNNKLIFIMRHKGDYKIVFPPQYIGYYAIDFSDEDRFSIKLKELLHRIYQEPLYRKNELGVKPDLKPINSVNETLESEGEISQTGSDVIVIDNVRTFLDDLLPDKRSTLNCRFLAELAHGRAVCHEENEVYRAADRFCLKASRDGYSGCRGLPEDGYLGGDFL